MVSHSSEPRPIDHVGWIAASGLLGFGVTALTAGHLRLSRSRVVLAHSIATTAVVLSYAHHTNLDTGPLVRGHWKRGILGGAAVGAFVVQSVRRQPQSPRPRGVQLAGDLVWSGVVYGVADALLLNVLPVLATRRALPESDAIRTGLAGMAASLAVTAAYHLGYPEFRGSALIGPLIGDVISAGYAASGNPLAAIIAHVSMHLAAVLQGAEGTIQLPPHYV